MRSNNIKNATLMLMCLIASQNYSGATVIAVSSSPNPIWGSEYQTPTQDFAQSFTTGGAGNYDLAKITFLMDPGFGSGGFMLSIYNDNLGMPGSSLSTLSGNANPIVPGVYNFIPQTAFSLSSSTTYWVVASGSHVGDYGYHWLYTQSPGGTALPDWSLGGRASGLSGAWAVNPNRNLMMDVVINSPPVPEPSISILVSLGFGLLLCKQRRGD